MKYVHGIYLIVGALSLTPHRHQQFAVVKVFRILVVAAVEGEGEEEEDRSHQNTPQKPTEP